jgi:16S rRNA (cytosine967-C5)-methyltransferase
MDVTPLASRRAAVDVLMACLDKGQPLDDALAGHRGFTALDPRDRAFVRLLLATTLRHSRAPMRSAARSSAWAPPS